jgi:hypothetical protein
MLLNSERPHQTLYDKTCCIPDNLLLISIYVVLCTLCHGIRELCVYVSVGDVFDVSANAVMLKVHLHIYITFDASVLDRLAHSST